MKKHFVTIEVIREVEVMIEETEEGCCVLPTGMIFGALTKNKMAFVSLTDAEEDEALDQLTRDLESGDDQEDS